MLHVRMFMEEVFGDISDLLSGMYQIHGKLINTFTSFHCLLTFRGKFTNFPY